MILVLDTKAEDYRIIASMTPSTRDLTLCRELLDESVLDIINNHMHPKRLPTNK